MTQKLARLSSSILHTFRIKLEALHIFITFLSFIVEVKAAFPGGTGKTQLVIFSMATTSRVFRHCPSAYKYVKRCPFGQVYFLF